MKKLLVGLVLLNFFSSHAVEPNKLTDKFNVNIDDRVAFELYRVTGEGAYADEDLDSSSGYGGKLDINLNDFVLQVGIDENDTIHHLDIAIGITDYYGNFRLRSLTEIYAATDVRRNRNTQIHLDIGFGVEVSRIFGSRRNHLMGGVGVRYGSLETIEEQEYNESKRTLEAAPIFLTLDVHNEVGKKISTDVVGRLTFTTEMNYKISVDSTAYLKVTKYLSALAKHNYESFGDYQENIIRLGFSLGIK